LLAEHNLHVTFEEIRTIKQAIRTGNLFELVENRARAHPAMLDGYRALGDHAAQLERTDPASKGAFFYLSGESAARPEVVRHHQRLSRLNPEGRVLLTEGNPSSRYDESWNVVPPFGPFPRALSETYPLTAEIPDRMDTAGYESAARGVARLVEENPETEFTLAHRGWPESALSVVPDAVRTVDLSTV
ncbi:MAG: tRNA-guanine(15) transglycosylase, partial [Haladaptatus sp.]